MVAEYRSGTTFIDAISSITVWLTGGVGVIEEGMGEGGGGERGEADTRCEGTVNNHE